MKEIKEKLVKYIKDYLEEDKDYIDAAELGCAIDMLKDITKSIYYCKVVEAMEEHPDKTMDYINRVN